MFVYNVPSTPILLTVISLLYLLNIAEKVFNLVLEAGLLGSLAIGIIYGPEGADFLPDYMLQTLLVFGYIGLILLIFEAGLDTNLSLLYQNMVLSALVAGTGIVLPIIFSIFLLHFGYGYGTLQGFAAGASLSSTSLGTTLSLIKPEVRQTRAGIVLLSAALFDDVTGLIFAAIIQSFSSNTNVSGIAVARPILVSIAFTVVICLLVWSGRPLARKMPYKWKLFVYQGRTQLFLMTVVISGLVAGANYAGTSELYGAYLAGVLVAKIFEIPPGVERPSKLPSCYSSEVIPKAESSTLEPGGMIMYTPYLAFTVFIRPVLQDMLLPIFFASIGAALPIRSLGSVDGSSRVVWRGFAYALLMIIGKALTGVWLLVPPQLFTSRQFWRKKSQRNSEETTDTRADVPSLSKNSSAMLLGVAMVARGEIALIVSEISRPLLTERSQELFAIVIWAILLDTVAGALGVGLLLHSFSRERTVTRPVVEEVSFSGNTIGSNITH